MKVVPLFMIEQYLNALDDAHMVGHKEVCESPAKTYQRKRAWMKVNQTRVYMLANAVDASIIDGPLCAWGEDIYKD